MLKTIKVYWICVATEAQMLGKSHSYPEQQYSTLETMVSREVSEDTEESLISGKNAEDSESDSTFLRHRHPVTSSWSHPWRDVIKLTSYRCNLNPYFILFFIFVWICIEAQMSIFCISKSFLCWKIGYFVDKRTFFGVDPSCTLYLFVRINIQCRTEMIVLCCVCFYIYCWKYTCTAVKNEKI